MRIDGFGIQISGVQNAQSASSVSFETGDVFIADVQNSEGDAVVLKMPDGRFLSARIMENVVLHQNDRVEFIVTQSGEDSLVLRIAYVEPHVSESLPQTALSAAEAVLLELFEQSGIRPDTRTLSSALRMMQQNSLTPKAAFFFALNRMVATPERLAAYQALTSGQGIGETFYDAAQSLFTLLGEPPDRTQPPVSGPAQALEQLPAQAQVQGQLHLQAQAPVKEQTKAQAQAPIQDRAQVQAQVPALEQTQAQTQTNVQPAQQNGAEAPMGGADAAGAQKGRTAAPSPDVPNTAQADNALAQSAKGAAQPVSAEQSLRAPSGEAPMVHQSGIGVRVQTALKSEAAELLSHPQRMEETVKITQFSSGEETAATAAPEGGTPLNTDELLELPKRILDLFLRFTGNESGADIKKFVAGSKERLETLKFITGKYDEESIRLVKPQLTQAEAQSKLAEDVTRFFYYQLPVYSGEYGTAELFVYRRAKSKGKIDADNASVLICIPTENFGRVETLLRTELGTLSVNFSVERQSGINVLKEGVKEFRKTFAAKTKYHLGEMRVGEMKERTTVENAESVLSGGTKRSGAIDVKI